MSRSRAPLAGVVGALVVVEATSGVLQGYYTPLLSDVARHLGIHDADVNWFEASQLLLSAIVVPLLARLGDMIGHRKVLIGSLIVTAAASWGVAFAPSFWLFTLLWALQGFYVVWLPMNVSIIHARARKHPNTAELTSKGAGLIVVALQAGAIGGALVAGQLGGLIPLHLTLAVPAVLVTVALLVVILKVEDPGVRAGGRVDSSGTVLLSLSLLAITGGLALARVNGFTLWVWAMVLVGAALMWWFVQVERRKDDPVIDMHLITRPTLWPVILTSALFGVSVLGAQGPLSTFAGTDPTEVGYGLGLDSASRSYLIGAYVLSLLVGAGLYARISKALQPRRVLIAAATLVGAGYLLLVPLHGGVPTVTALMIVAGLGSGALVAALPATAAAAAPPHQTGVATGLTNTTKTLGGAFASAVFALALANGVDSETTTAASLSGYQTVWAICGVTAFVAVGALLTVPKVAFTSADPDARGLDESPEALALEAVGHDVVVSDAKVVRSEESPDPEQEGGR
ncbi:MFS transporter [Demequina capsici]|uniref:MFS transporter n=1 Tax=Demequina capsici TaxID=3075620 RepID=A0AA96JAV5_9MICO|nr:MULTISPECIES: MFS transporter [unclassified Demequina]WNM24843.1 MFS transporter [Demequina sp. OYTSA14]WNM27750.1 MFS transporter [Demequina sp. PMTSA13]